MSEERFVQIEQKLDRVEQRVDRVEQKLDHVAADVEVLKADMVEVKSDLRGVAGRVEDLDRHMHVLQEEAMDRIRALGEHDTLRAEMRSEFKSLRDVLTQHIALSDVTDRRFVRRLDDHERRITSLERK
jgi:chromosome segregation ATPase